jgi:hypothetical protein
VRQPPVGVTGVRSSARFAMMLVVSTTTKITPAGGESPWGGTPIYDELAAELGDPKTPGHR